MTWIHFGHDEGPAPSITLHTPDGSSRSIADSRGLSNLVVFFPHNHECEQCLNLISRISDQHVHWDSEILVIVPVNNHYQQIEFPGIELLIDLDQKLRKQYRSIFEFNPPGEVMLFILNNSSVPVRAWVGDELDVGDLVQRIEQTLEFLSIQCPE